MNFGSALTRLFGSRNDRLLKRYLKIVDKVNTIEPQIAALTDAQLRDRTQELRRQNIAGEITMTDCLSESLAIVRESMDRHIGIREIFNPERDFNPDKLDDAGLEMYDSVQRAMIEKGVDWQRVEIPHEIYAAVRKLYPESRPPYRARCFDVQLIGGLVLFEGRIAEMRTGEGKTFVAPLACFLRNVQGMRAHVVTVNDYLVRRDATWVRPAFVNLGLNVGFVQSDMDPGGDTRRRAYQADVTYGTNSEFGFDYLRDNMKERLDLQVQGPLDFAIVDEVDSILIDEARTPLIISGAAHDNAARYRAADEVARKVIDLHRPYAAIEKQVDDARRSIKAASGDLDKASDKAEKDAARGRIAAAQKALTDAEEKKAGVTSYYDIERERKSVHMTHEGIASAQEFAGVGSFYVGDNLDWPHLMEQSLRAHVVYEKDVDYVVERGSDPRSSGEMEVVIVDEYTGRKMVGRQWSDGLHQAVEAKERVPIKRETQTMATITLQNFFKLYKQLSGMTGTAMTEIEEFSKIYKLEVVAIPTNRPVVRDDSNDLVFRTEPEKWTAILEEIREFAQKGRPVLVGTTSVEKSEMLSNLLTRKYGIKHEVLNAKQHEREAYIVEHAGEQNVDHRGETIGNVTIATNMAGRGTDIKLTPGALQAGGLHVLGTERHTARRIDNQLRGRAGRQGDPGSSRFYVSLQDDLMKMFAGEWTIRVLGFLGMKEGEAIEDKRISKGIANAQKKVEEKNYLGRKQLLDYDEVMDHQRTVFYGLRQRVLEGREVERVIWDMIGEAIQDAVTKFVVDDYAAVNIVDWARDELKVGLDTHDLRGIRRVSEVEELVKNAARNEMPSNIDATLGEYLGEDREDTKQWNVKDLSTWAHSNLGFEISEQELKRMDFDTLQGTLVEAGQRKIDAADTAPLKKFLDPNFGNESLIAWAREKFGVDVELKDFVIDAERRLTLPSEQIAKLLDEKARRAYRQREAEYPVDHVFANAFGQGATDGNNSFGAEYIRNWSKAKFDVELSEAEVLNQPLQPLRDRFVELSLKALETTSIEAEADKLLAGEPDAAALAQRWTQRFLIPIDPKQLDPRTAVTAKGTKELDQDGDGALTRRDIVIRRIRSLLRMELTDLEQYVLISIFDQTWKDHLYAMDMLKGGIGLQAFAEKDPRVAFKREGYKQFQAMMALVRDKATDLIFRVYVTQDKIEARSNYKVTAQSAPSPSPEYGVSETEALPAPAATATLTRDEDKVGRNDPCPCGSGKKYKKCCGVGVA